MPATAGTNRPTGSSAPEDGTPVKQDVNLSFPGTRPFTINYDKLVIACGAYSQTFNTPGVKEYALFLKDVKVTSSASFGLQDINSRVSSCVL